MKDKDFAWLAGLFEGEGTFGIVKGKAYTISLTSTDLDVIEKVNKIFSGSIYKYSRSRLKEGFYKDAYVWLIRGENAYTFCNIIKPYLLSRRLERCNEWMSLYESRLLKKKIKEKETEDRNIKIIELFNSGLKHKEIAQMFGIERSSVTKIINGGCNP